MPNRVRCVAHPYALTRMSTRKVPRRSQIRGTVMGDRSSSTAHEVAQLGGVQTILFGTVCQGSRKLFLHFRGCAPNSRLGGVPAI